jgi:pimeloyl-ACP methyl ester carboxylesterase
VRRAGEPCQSVGLGDAGSKAASSRVTAWKERGEYRRLKGHNLFTLVRPATGPETREPLLVLHGFPTCSFDFHLVLEELACNRRVLLIDMLGFGLSDKPDIHYGIELQADLVEEFVSQVLVEGDRGASRTGITAERDPLRLALLTHDMGDSVGGELLARQLDGRWNVEITKRILTNGSIYIDMANLSNGQKMLLSLPDERLAASLDSTGGRMKAALTATLSSDASITEDELDDAWELVAHNGGDLLLPRLIRYIEDRRRDEARYTGAIERHPSPLTIIWGVDDPIAVLQMATRLSSVRRDSSLVTLDSVGHYPMIEAPQMFATAADDFLSG